MQRHKYGLTIKASLSRQLARLCDADHYSLHVIIFMSIYEEEIVGGEFDWFAMDLDGDIAIMSTAGEGSVPEEAVESYQKHNEVSESIETPNWGSSEVWSDYAALGLFVFDWQLPGGPYLRERSPENGLEEDLKNKILAIGTLPQLPIKFRSTKQIDNVPKNI